ncbi:MAG: type II toxin-antitoxin system death-on-curing family toxin [Limisphaerales bacterium]
MNEPVFLSVEHVEYLHRESITRYGGILGVRDRAGLEAAVNHPINVFYYGQGDLFDIAAAYAYHIAEAQAFLDGNKRTAIAAALNFLNLNGCKAVFDPLALYDAMIAIAERRMTKSQFAASLRQQARS